MFSERLRIARQKTGLSLRALEEKINKTVSAQAIGRYERGEIMPTPHVAEVLSEALHVSLSHLFSEPDIHLKELKFRELRGTKAHERAQVEAMVRDHMERYLHIEDLLNVSTDHWDSPQGAPFSVNHLSEVEHVAEMIRKQWDLGSHPIGDFSKILENHGIKVLKLDFPLSVDGMACQLNRRNKPPLPVIVCTLKKSLERERFTMAQELGQMVLDAEDSLKEKFCQVFAGAFLVPKDDLINEVGNTRKNFSYVELLGLKKAYGISAAALVNRLRDLDIIGQTTAKRILYGVGKRWRQEEPDPLTREKQPQRFQRLCYQALAEKIMPMNKAADLLGIHSREMAKLMSGSTVHEDPPT